MNMTTKMIKVKSEALNSIGWDSQNNKLLIELPKGTYAYDAPRDEYDRLLKAKSHGKYFNKAIRNTYKFELL